MDVWLNQIVVIELTVMSSFNKLTKNNYNVLEEFNPANTFLWVKRNLKDSKYISRRFFQRSFYLQEECLEIEALLAN